MVRFHRKNKELRETGNLRRSRVQKREKRLLKKLIFIAKRKRLKLAIRALMVAGLSQ